MSKKFLDISIINHEKSRSKIIPKTFKSRKYKLSKNEFWETVWVDLSENDEKNGVSSSGLVDLSFQEFINYINGNLNKEVYIY